MTAVPARRVAAGADVRTTAAPIFVRNLAAQLRSATRLVAEAPWLTADRKHLAQLHEVCGDCRSDLHAYAAALTVLDDGPQELMERDAEVHVIRAKLHLALHRLAEAKAALARAIDLGAGARVTSELATEIDWNEGRCHAAALAILKTAASDPTTYSLARVARLEMELGRHEQARSTFEKAHLLFAGTQPYASAWLSNERAENELAAGDLDQAEAFASAATRRLPHYLAARATLGRILARRGDVDRAIAELQWLADQSDNPEHWSELIRLRRLSGDIDDAATLTQRAQARWSELLAEFPEAMYWHAADFYLEIADDPHVAAELLRANASLRPNPASWRALARAERACARPGTADALDKLAAPVERLLLSVLDTGRSR